MCTKTSESHRECIFKQPKHRQCKMNVTSTANDYIKHEINDDDFSDPLHLSGFHGLLPDKEAFAITSQFEHQQEDFIKSNLEDIDVKLEPHSPPTEKIYIKRELLAHSGVNEEVPNFWSSEDVRSDTAESECYVTYPGKSNLSEVSNSDIKEETLSFTYDTGGSHVVDEFDDNKSQNLYNQTKECYVGVANANITNITNQKVRSNKNQSTIHTEKTKNCSPSSLRKADNNDTDEDNIFKEEPDLESFKTEEPENTKPFRCNVCDFSTGLNKNLTMHLRIHADTKLYHCNFCDYKAVQKGTIKNHMRTHTGEKPFCCNVCDFRTAYKNSLTNHLQIHADEKPFQCSVCDYKAVHKQNLIKHMRTHTGEKPFQCNICEYRAVHKQNLIKHIRIHTGEKTFQCNVCDYKAIYKQHLTTHMRTHTGEKPFQCNICDYRAVHKQNLIKHIRTHTGEKPFQCNACDYRAVYKQHLITHMRTHTGEKPFQCNVCDLRLTQKGSLLRHMRAHNNKTLYQ